jgi:hypothetical protein
VLKIAIHASPIINKKLKPHKFRPNNVYLSKENERRKVSEYAPTNTLTHTNVIIITISMRRIMEESIIDDNVQME